MFHDQDNVVGGRMIVRRDSLFLTKIEHNDILGPQHSLYLLITEAYNCLLVALFVDVGLGHKLWFKCEVVDVEARHATVKFLSLIYGRLDERALRVGKPISSSARSQAFYSSIVCTSTL